MRVNYYEAFPDGLAAMQAMEKAVHASGLEPSLLELVKVRASQINGCGYCLAMHTRDARHGGEKQTRLDTVGAWRETPFFTAREQAALAWCEAMTELPRYGSADDRYESLAKEFTAQEIAALSFAIAAINTWNRLAVGLGADVTTLDGLDATAAG